MSAIDSSIKFAQRFDLLVFARETLENASRARKNTDLNTVYPHGDTVVTTEDIIAEAKKLEAYIES